MLAAAPPRVGLALLQVDLPADVVRLQRGGVGIEVEDLVDHHLEQRGVVADHHQAAAERLQVVAQPGHRVGVQVVGGLVQQQGLRVGEQDPGQLHPAPLPAGQGGQRLAQHPVRQAQAGGDRRGLSLGGVAAEQGEPFFQLAVAADRGVTAGAGPRRTSAARRRAWPAGSSSRPRPDSTRSRASPSRSPDRGVLGQVADARAAPHRARGGERLAGEHPGQRGLARAVPADQADLVARRRSGNWRRPAAAARPRAAQRHVAEIMGTSLHLTGTGSDADTPRNLPAGRLRPWTGAWRHVRSGCMLPILPEAGAWRPTG